jgi:hypothetical protein
MGQEFSRAPATGQTKPINLLPSHIFKINFNIIHRFMRKLYGIVVSAGFPTNPCVFCVWNRFGITEREQRAATNKDGLLTQGYPLKGRLFEMGFVGGFWSDIQTDRQLERSRLFYVTARHWRCCDIGAWIIIVWNHVTLMTSSARCAPG